MFEVIQIRLQKMDTIQELRNLTNCRTHVHFIPKCLWATATAAGSASRASTDIKLAWATKQESLAGSRKLISLEAPRGWYRHDGLPMWPHAPPRPGTEHPSYVVPCVIRRCNIHPFSCSYHSHTLHMYKRNHICARGERDFANPDIQYAALYSTDHAWNWQRFFR